jgi:hypothetical protein
LFEIEEIQIHGARCYLKRVCVCSRRRAAPRWI